MSAQHHGSCLCGESRFQIEGRFESFYFCHCTHCRKDTGAAHAANLFSSSARLVWLSGKGSIKTFTLPGTRHTKTFCTRCGSALPSQQHEGQLLVVPAGSLDSEVSAKPDAHIFVASSAAWDRELESVQRYDQLP